MASLDRRDHAAREQLIGSRDRLVDIAARISSHVDDQFSAAVLARIFKRRLQLARAALFEEGTFKYATLPNCCVVMLRGWKFDCWIVKSSRFVCPPRRTCSATLFPPRRRL